MDAFEEFDRFMSEDPEDRRIMENHGFTYEDDFRDLTLLCRNGCGLTYLEVVQDKIEKCRGKDDNE